MTMNKPTSVVEQADKLLQEAEALFRDKMSTMGRDYREVAEDQMRW